MRYNIIDNKSKSHKLGINWLSRMCLKYLKNRGVIMSDEYSIKTFEYLFMSGGYSALRNVRNPNGGFEEFKNRELL